MYLMDAKKKKKKLVIIIVVRTIKLKRKNSVKAN